MTVHRQAKSTLILLLRPKLSRIRNENYQINMQLRFIAQKKDSKNRLGKITKIHFAKLKYKSLKKEAFIF